jgi:hypothetical protein
VKQRTRRVEKNVIKDALARTLKQMAESTEHPKPTIN